MARTGCFLRRAAALSAAAALTQAAVHVSAQVPSGTPAGVSAAADWVAPRTPWGHPDLQGIWTSDEEYGVPLERPAALGTRALVSEEELAARQAEAEQRARLEFADRSRLTEAEKADVPPELPFGPVGDGPEHWFELGTAVSPRNSLIVDPPNGRIPRLTPGAQLRIVDPRTVVGFETGVGSKGRGPFNGPEEFDLADRCITRGLPNTRFPQVYNNGFQIVQHQDYVAVLYERLHRINEYHFRQFGHLVKKLAATPEGDGTPLANLYMTILEKMGFPLEKFGDSTGLLKNLSV